jgi:hypothetical protein
MERRGMIANKLKDERYPRKNDDKIVHPSPGRSIGENAGCKSDNYISM